MRIQRQARIDLLINKLNLLGRLVGERAAELLLLIRNRTLNTDSPEVPKTYVTPT
jgi:hypothetical protein